MQQSQFTTPMALFEQDFSQDLCADKFDLQAAEQHSEQAVPRRNIFAQTNYDDMDFFTKKPANVMYEENSAHLERDQYNFAGKAVTTSSSDFLECDKKSLVSREETNFASSEDSNCGNFAGDWLQNSPSFNLSLQKQSSGGSMDFSNGPANSIIPENLEINLDSLIHSPSMGSPKLEPSGATTQLLDDSFANQSSHGSSNNDVRGCTVI